MAQNKKQVERCVRFSPPIMEESVGQKVLFLEQDSITETGGRQWLTG